MVVPRPPATRVATAEDLVRYLGSCRERYALERDLPSAGIVTRLVLQVVPAADATAFRLTLNTMKDPEKVAARDGWGAIPAVRDGELHEIKSPMILQPGPAALTDGVGAIAAIIRDWAVRHG